MQQQQQKNEMTDTDSLFHELRYRKLFKVKLIDWTAGRGHAQ